MSPFGGRCRNAGCKKALPRQGCKPPRPARYWTAGPAARSQRRARFCVSCLNGRSGVNFCLRAYCATSSRCTAAVSAKKACQPSRRTNRLSESSGTPMLSAHSATVRAAYVTGCVTRCCGSVLGGGAEDGSGRRWRNTFTAKTPPAACAARPAPSQSPPSSQCAPSRRSALPAPAACDPASPSPAHQWCLVRRGAR